MYLIFFYIVAMVITYQYTKRNHDLMFFFFMQRETININYYGRGVYCPFLVGKANVCILCNIEFILLLLYSNVNCTV